jgi:DedD protein
VGKREPAAAVVPDPVEDEPAAVIEPPKAAEKVADKPVAKAAEKTAEKAAEKTVAKPTAPAEVKSADIMPPSFETRPAPAAGSPAAPGAPVVATKDTGKKPRFMLQVGSFPDKSEAEAYASSFAAERAIVVMSEIPGKGTWYRVRLGGFQAFQDAVDAKAVFERRYNKIALVVGPL